MLGFISVYKPSGMTSNAVVQKIKRQFKINKIGHMGTLDPMACGILPLAVGKATRLFDYMLAKTKKYIAIFDFGYETDSLDITGNITKGNGIVPKQEDIMVAINSMIGKQMQYPPKYSAKNINGKRAYDLARLGVDFELKPKEIEIFDFKLIEKISDIRYKFEIVCSSGTYIRSIGRDLAEKLQTYATMSFLERSEMGAFNLNNSIYLDNILEFQKISEIILSPLQVLTNFDIINIDEKTYIDLINGKFVSFPEVKHNSFVMKNDKIIGIAKPRKNQLKIDTYLEDKND